MHILVTGGAGYIGSHTAVQLLEAGYEVTVVDNLLNSSEEALVRVEEITGKKLKFYKIDMLDKDALRRVFEENKFDAAIHFAGLKAVGESVAKPLWYYHNNILSTVNLCELMTEFGVKKLVFSSSATVYGRPKSVPISEDFELSCTNPYGRTKLMIEEILRDVAVSDPEWGIAILRYFNPVGAHQSGMIGEDPQGIPNNLMPYIAQVAVGKRDFVHVFGNDYDTHDGTGVRDYIHVVDLADGHLCALKKIENEVGVVTYNLGTGTGYSVLDMIAAFSKACGRQLPYEIEARRPGDIDACFADPQKAKDEIGFEAKRTLEDMCADSWNWQQKNPNGYKQA
ncbi:MAG: UDP-glucose 4-epimerase GalE [Clostridia bacterium]|nr:UDP-glucose 4-epimerase GalE [Clostridia bacterium]